MNITMTTPIKIKINLAKYVVTRPINTQMSTIASAAKNRLANNFSIFYRAEYRQRPIDLSKCKQISKLFLLTLLNQNSKLISTLTKHINCYY